MSKKMTYESVKEYIESFGYVLLDEKYERNNIRLKMICDKGHDCEISYSNFQQGRRCKHCKNENNGDRKRHSYHFIQECFSSFGYKLLSKEYTSNKEKLKIQCPNNHIFEMSFDSFKRGQRCPYCKISKGEKKIMDYLDNNGMEYVYDKPYFEDLLSPIGNLLRPDFILPNHKIWIEYDGEFHYRKTYADDGFEKFQIYDKIKDEYAKRNNWRLIRIPYWEFENIEKILFDLFNRYE